jgi:hypothetical protein
VHTHVLPFFSILLNVVVVLVTGVVALCLGLQALAMCWEGPGPPGAGRAAAGLFLLGSGVAALLLGGALLLQEVPYAAEGRAVAGRYTAFTVQTLGSRRLRRTAYMASYRFETLDGRPAEGRQELKRWVWQGLDPDDPVAVQYLPSDPDMNRPAGTGGLALSLCLLVPGAITAVLGGYLLGRCAHRWRRSEHSAVPTDPLEVVRRALHPEEQLIWAERAEAMALARSRLGWGFLAGVVVVGVFPLTRLLKGDLPLAKGENVLDLTPMLLPLGGAFLFGLLLVLEPLWAAYRARTTLYAISDRRLLIVNLFPLRQIQSFPPEELNMLECTERPDGSGDLVFREAVMGSGRSRQTKRFGFFGVPEVRRVEDEVRRLAARG